MADMACWCIKFQAVRDQYNGFKSTLTPQQLASSTNQLAELDAGLDIIQKAFTNLCDVSMARETGRVKLEWNNWNGQPGGAYGDMRSSKPLQKQAFPSACPHNNHVPISAPPARP
jgi:hypothetical protein